MLPDWFPDFSDRPGDLDDGSLALINRVNLHKDYNRVITIVNYIKMITKIIITITIIPELP